MVAFRVNTDDFQNIVIPYWYMEYVLVFVEENHCISDTAAKLNKNECVGEKV
jgi:hypothetical protein